MKNKTFTDFLQDKFMKDYHGTKDDCQDRFENWLTNLQVDALIDYADIAILEAKIEMLEEAKVGLERINK